MVGGGVSEIFFFGRLLASARKKLGEDIQNGDN